ncbi:hypothetical protein [Saccharicrinis sp. 156]|uniref:hypothetical protein n=1 Tax=Saccharicrinis sp. 156 TaxID=3417574 RepID=UPI003D33AEE6
MKAIIYLTIVFFIAMQTPLLGQSSDAPKYFDNPEEAVKQATSDMIQTIKELEQFNFGIDPEHLKKAKPGPVIENAELNFERLLNSEADMDISKLADKTKNYLYPLYFDKKVLTLVELKKEEKGWLIRGFSPLGVADELSALLRSYPDLQKLKIAKYEIQNLASNVYIIVVNGKQNIHTNYNNKFSLNQPTPSSEALKILKEDAIKFKKEFGDIVKKQKLVD